MLIKLNQYLKKSINFLGNLRLAIVLLLILALCSALGTIIEQNQNISFYENSYPNSAPFLGFISSNVIFFFGLNNIYQTWWFTALIILLAVSLFSCTLSRQIPSLKMARLWQFYTKNQNIKKLGLNFILAKTSLSKFAFVLKKCDYNVIQKGGILYAYKGLPGKIGPIIVHISLIIILFGSLIGNLSGFVSQELVPLGGVFHIQNIISSGPLTYVPQNFEGYIKEFKIAYNEEGSIDQFYSNLLLLNTKGDKIKEKIIYVNEPLRYKGIVFYQTDWNLNSLSVNIDQKANIQLPLKPINIKGEGKFWIASLPIENNQNNEDITILLVLKDLTGKVLIYSSNQELLGILDIGSAIPFNGHMLRITNITSSTGLQIKSDPGIPIVYIGFLLLILSIILSYFSYSQIWAIKDNKKLYISGRTNRAIYAFEQQLTTLIRQLNNSYT